MSPIPDAWKAALMAECKRVKLSDQGTIDALEKRLEKRANKLHKRSGNVGRPPSAIKVLLLRLLKKMHLGQTGSIEMLVERYKKHSTAPKSPKSTIKKQDKKSDVLDVNRAHVSADEIQSVLNLSAGQVCRFSNGNKKMIVEASTGGYRWKSL